ncbi:MAG: 4'-phosphopantetheinyl transferase superfamily protein [Pseudomonadota bacterium]
MHDDTIIVWRIDLDAPREDTQCLTTAEQARADRFVTEPLRRRWMASRAALRQALGERLGIDPAAVRIKQDDNRKPYLCSSHCSSLQFNLTHSDAHALIAVCDSASIGIDVEVIKPRKHPDQVAQRSFSDSEQRAYFATSSVAVRLEMFYRIWTRKEAVIKATGEGLTAHLDRFDVAVDLPASVIADRNPGRSAQHWQMWHCAAQSIVGAIAVHTPTPMHVTIAPCSLSLDVISAG